MNGEPSSAENPTSTEQQVLPAGEYSAREIFSRVGGEVKTDHKYFVENPPERVKLNEDQLRDLESKEPFFVDVAVTKNPDGRTHFSAKPNKDVVPYVFDQELGRRVERFAKAEDLTKDDSGILALAAISGETPEQQAILYKTISEIVLDVHQNNPNLLKDWLEAQINSSDPINSSVQIFYLHQIGRGQETGDFNEVLLPMNPTLDPRMAESMWAPRMAELREALTNDKLQPHHLRWIEYLSHSVDIQNVFEHVKSAQTDETTSPSTEQTLETNEPAVVPKEAVAETLPAQTETRKPEIAEFGEVGETIGKINELVEKLRESGFHSSEVSFNNGAVLSISLTVDKNGNRDPRFNRPVTIRQSDRDPNKELTDEEHRNIHLAHPSANEFYLRYGGNTYSNRSFTDKDGFKVLVGTKMESSSDGKYYHERITSAVRSKEITEPSVQALFSLRREVKDILGRHVQTTSHALGEFSSVRDPQEGLNVEEIAEVNGQLVSPLRERPKVGEKDSRLEVLKYIQAGLEFEVNNQNGNGTK